MREQKAIGTHPLASERVFQDLPIPSMIVDGSAVVRGINRAAVEFCGASAETLPGQRLGDALGCIHHGQSPGGCGTGEACKTCPLRASVGQTLTELKGPMRLEATLRRERAGQPEQCIVLVSATPLAGDDAGRVLLCLEDVTDRRLVEERLRAAAETDGLTGLANRTVFNEAVGLAIERHATGQTRGYAALFLDFDYFKVVNDSLGHAQGDLLLRQIAARVRKVLGPGDDRCLDRPLAARLGGDEFAILLPNTDRPDAGVQMAERLQRALNRPYLLDGYPVVSTASIGITSSSMKYERADDVVRDADTAMYEAKRAGRGRHVVFDSPMHERAKARMELETDLRHALDGGEFVLHYQPIVSLETGRITAFEALIRWNHPRRGLLAPGEFIGVAEETGLIVDMGEWVAQEACRQLAAWRGRFGPALPIHVNVNVSRRQLMQPGLAEKLLRAASASGIAPQQLCLEITESAIMEDTGLAGTVLTTLKALAFQLAMDDFGTGYSSLSCLHRFPLTSLKIDRSFIAHLSGHSGYAAVVQAIVTLAHNLGMKVTAEGVENADQIPALQALECDFAQGYYFGRPMGAPAAEGVLADDLIKQRAA